MDDNERLEDGELPGHDDQYSTTLALRIRARSPVEEDRQAC